MVRQIIAAILAIGLMGAVSAGAAAAQGGKGPKPGEAPKKVKPLVGTILKVDGNKITLSVSGGGAGEYVITTDDKTAVEIKGNAAKLADLKPGMIITVDPPTGTAKKIAVPDAKLGGKGKGKKDKDKEKDK
jgi:hypothetical protein